MQAAAIRIESLAKTYHPAAGPVRVFEGLSMAAAERELLAIMGPSGAGKSTLLHIIGALDTADSGSVTIFERDLAVMSPDERAAFRNASIGFVFQFHFLLPEFTALENVMIPSMIAGRGRREAREAASAELAAVGLDARAGHYPSELSGGEQQRVAIARALVMRPRLLLMDEPTGNLDSRTAHAVMETILARHASAGITAVVVTHNEKLAAMCGRTLVLEDGRLSGPEG